MLFRTAGFFVIWILVNSETTGSSSTLGPRASRMMSASMASSGLQALSTQGFLDTESQRNAA